MPVALIAQLPLILIARKDFPGTTFQNFVKYAKENQDKMSFGSAGTGSSTHLGCELLNAALGIKVQHVPYRGGAPAMIDLAAGRLDYVCEIVNAALPQIHGGNVKAIATLTRERTPVLKDLPTANESGLPGFEAYTWMAIFLPQHTPAPIVAKLHDATVAAMKTPSVKDRLEELGATLAPDDRNSPDYLSKFVKSEIEKWAGPIKASGATAD